MRGNMAFTTQKLHDRYGPVVRIAPAHLSFTAARAWRDIYSPLAPASSGSGWPELPKSRAFSAPLDPADHIANAEYQDHARLRRALGPGFSDAALRRQEPMVIKYVDQLLDLLHARSEGGKAPLDMAKWYNWTTFDIIGDLVFGQSFGCLDRCDYHPWISFILGFLGELAASTAIVYLGGRWLLRLVFRVAGAKAFAQMQAVADGFATRRLAMDKGRDDLFEGLLKHQDELVRCSRPCAGSPDRRRMGYRMLTSLLGTEPVL